MSNARFTNRWLQTTKAPQHGQVDYIDESLPGFTLRVTARGTRTWTVCYYYNRRRRRLTLGRFPSVSLAEARKRAFGALAKVSGGVDPAAERARAAHQGTFRDLQAQYMAKYARPKKKPKSIQNDEWILRRHLLPQWSHVKATDITRLDVRRVIEPIAETRPVLANRVLALISGIFAFAVGRDWRPDNPAYGVEPPGRETPRKRKLTESEIRAIWDALDEEDPFFQALFKLRFLTAARGGEIRTMRWCDVNLLSGWWIVPEERSKNGRATSVPLTAEAVTLLKQLSEWQETRLNEINEGRLRKRWDLLSRSEWVFPSPRGDGQSFQWEQRAALRVRARSGVEFRFHDVRRTVATCLTKHCGVDRFILKQILNHSDGDITGVYDLNTYDSQKRTALEAWGRRLRAIVEDREQPSNVVAMGQR